MKQKKVILAILDGWGIGPKDKQGNYDQYNAIANAKTPNIERLIRDYPNTSIATDGLSVGLPEGQNGTSDVNHTTIGAGRVILQALPKINKSIETGEFFNNKEINATVDHVEDQGAKAKLHLAGIVSDGGIHSQLDHLEALLRLLKRRNFENEVYIHVFTDGRDTAPKSAEKYLHRLETKLVETGIGTIASIQGRYFLDRDRDWDRTEKAYRLIANGSGHKVSSWKAALNFSYNKNITDEYIDQFSIEPEAKVKEGDGLIFFHYRTDRLHQILQKFIEAKHKNISITSFVQPSKDFTELKIAFPQAKVDHTLAGTISLAGLSQLHITETEKYSHLTYFFNGRREQEYTNESWVLHESNRFVKPYYNVDPSMQNFKITESVIKAITHNRYDFIVTNLSSPDMVGHTGNYEAAVVSAESIDYCIGKIYDEIKDKLDEYTLIITADHGNSEEMWDYDNDQPHTQHTNNKVPLILVSNAECRLKRQEDLTNIAPTILKLLGLKAPSTMTGTNLIHDKIKHYD